MQGTVFFYVVWWSSIAATFALLGCGMPETAAPFVALSLLCLGCLVGWRMAGRGERR